jgi:hypothetical protein
MKLKKHYLLVLGIILPLFVNGCSLPVTKIDVQSYEFPNVNVKSDKALNTLVSVFVDRGFDIKMTNLDAGIVTTEYKKFISIGGNPPFDYYMQIKGRVKTANKVLIVELIPNVKEQNRMNTGAFTEHQLSYFVGNPSTINSIRSMKAGTGWRAEAQTVFSNVVADTANAFHISADSIKQNISKSEVNAFGQR